MIERYKMLVFRGVKNSVDIKLSARELVRKLWRKTGLFVVSAAGFALSGCADGLPTLVPLDGPASQRVSGYVVSDSPQAALIGSYTLEDGGTAADAAVATGFALAVSLPSRAGLGGGGTCLYFDASSEDALVFEFQPGQPVIQNQPPRFSTAVPGLVRGLFAVHTEYGRQPWSANLVRAESAARFGDKVSRSLATDLANNAAALVNDRAALDRFMTNRRQFLQEGEIIRQVGLAGLLGRIRSGQVGSFYAGGLAQLLSEQAQVSGGVLSTTDLNGYRVKLFSPSRDIEGAYFWPVKAGPEQANTTFVILDTFGNAAACVLSMGQPFGAGLMIEDFGMLLSVPARGEGEQRLSIHVAEGRGVQSVAITPETGDGSDANGIQCEDGIMVEPERCLMTVRSHLSGLAIEAGERR